MKVKKSLTKVQEQSKKDTKLYWENSFNAIIMNSVQVSQGGGGGGGHSKGGKDSEFEVRWNLLF